MVQLKTIPNQLFIGILHERAVYFAKPPTESFDYSLCVCLKWVSDDPTICKYGVEETFYKYPKLKNALIKKDDDFISQFIIHQLPGIDDNVMFCYLLHLAAEYGHKDLLQAILKNAYVDYPNR